MKRILLLTILLCGCATQDRVDLVRVVDGDTIDVEIGGKKESVRIIGIDAPEMNFQSNNPECGALEAKLKLEEMLDGTLIHLVTSIGENRDKYDRLLRYVEISGIDVGELLLKQGYVDDFPWFTHSRLDGYKEMKRRAQEEKKGIWGVCEFENLKN